MTPQVEAKIWCWQNQRFLVRLFNNPQIRVGTRYLFGIRNMSPVIQVTPNTLVFFKEKQKDRILVEGRFYVKYEVFNTLWPIIEKMKIAQIKQMTESSFLNFSGLVPSQGFPLVMLANFNVGTGDGYVFVAGQASFAAARGATTGTANQAASEWDGVYTSELAANNVAMGRVFAPTDTSTITSAGVIMSGANTFTFTTTTILGTPRAVHLVQTSQASTGSVTADDYDNVSFTTGGNATPAAATTTYTITLNGTADPGWISKTGFTMTGLLSDPDQSNTEPPANGDQYARINSAGAGSNYPYLTINYLLPSALFGLGSEI